LRGQRLLVGIALKGWLSHCVNNSTALRCRWPLVVRLHHVAQRFKVAFGQLDNILGLAAGAQLLYDFIKGGLAVDNILASMCTLYLFVNNTKTQNAALPPQSAYSLAL